MTPEAKALISAYYIASRKRRGAAAFGAGSFGAATAFDACGGAGGGVEAAAAAAAFPSSAVATISSLAMAHAKLRLNNEVGRSICQSVGSICLSVSLLGRLF